MRTRFRWVANWMNLSTPAGLLVARAGGAQVSSDEDGLYWAEGYRFPFPVAGAFTMGNVIVTASRFEALGPEVARHEARHTWQWVACGTAFLPLYALSMGWSWLVTGDRAARNVFERRAGLVDGGYLDAPPRAWVVTAQQQVRRLRGSGRSRAVPPSGGAGARPEDAAGA